MRGPLLLCLLALSCMGVAPLFAQSARPMIAIIIDDLGNQKLLGERTVNLPGPVACAIMPHTAYSTHLAELAHRAGKEVILHLPMQGMDMQRIAGPGEISLDTTAQHLEVILSADLQDVPHAVGINNHMGSLITQHPGHMRWLMDDLNKRGDLFFVDSYTTAASVAYAAALDAGIASARRDVFLDNEAGSDIAAAFEQLKAEARAKGSAIGIGHPYAPTLSFLEQALPLLADQGFVLVPVGRLVSTSGEPVFSDSRADNSGSMTAVPPMESP